MPAYWRLGWVRGKWATHSSRVSKLPSRSRLDSFTKALVCALKASHLEKAHPHYRWAPTSSEFTDSSIKHTKEVLSKQKCILVLACSSGTRTQIGVYPPASSTIHSRKASCKTYSPCLVVLGFWKTASQKAQRESKVRELTRHTFQNTTIQNRNSIAGPSVVSGALN